MKTLRQSVSVLVVAAMAGFLWVGSANAAVHINSHWDTASGDGWTEFGGGWDFGLGVDPLDASKRVAARTSDPQDIIGAPASQVSSNFDIGSGAGYNLLIETEMRWRQGATGDWNMYFVNSGTPDGQMGTLFAVFRPNGGTLEFRVARNNGGGSVNVVQHSAAGLVLNPGAPGTYNKISIERDWATSSWTISLNDAPLAGFTNLVESTPITSSNFGGPNFIGLRTPQSDFNQGLGPNVMFDRFLLKTIQVPEPATMALVGLGGLLLVRRGRRA